MMACGLGIVQLALDGGRGRSAFLVASVIVSGAGLIVSGARGSWLALLCGLAVALAARIQSRYLIYLFVVVLVIFALELFF